MSNEPMLGVCCHCQEPHSVRPAGFDPDQDETDEMLDGPSSGYVMCSHEPTFGGGPCPGAGTTPQAVYEDTV